MWGSNLLKSGLNRIVGACLYRSLSVSGVYADLRLNSLSHNILLQQEDPNRSDDSGIHRFHIWGFYFLSQDGTGLLADEMMA